MSKRSLKSYLIFAVIFIFNCITIVCNDVSAAQYHSWADTPPMGWNSWDCYGCSVTEQEVKDNADYMAKNLKECGWEYVVVDIQWYEPKSDKNSRNPYEYPRKLDTNIDEYGRVWPVENKHPSSVNGNGFKPLAKYVHSLGLKFGVHMMRGIPKLAYERNTKVLGTNYTARDIANVNSTCPWNPDMYGVDASKPGAQEYYNSVMDMVASWGVDYVKIDDLSRPYYQGEIELIRNAIDQCGRKIVFSTSPGATPLTAGEHVAENANLWRISDDFWDSWHALKEQFLRLHNWSRYCGDGHYPDADMLPLGKVRARANGSWTKFSKVEQKTMMSLWFIARSPLMMGGNMPDNDEYTLSLMNNDEALYVNKYSQKGRQLYRKDELVVWTAEDRNSDDVFVAMFNAQDSSRYDTPDAKWKSPVLTGSSIQKAVPFAVSLKDKSELYLIVEDGGDGYDYDHADWLDMVLIDKQGGKSQLSDLKWKRATAGWGSIGINKSIEGNELVVEKKVYKSGIGTHSNSVIEYELPAGKYVELRGLVGIDDEVAQSRMPGAKVQFFVYTSKPEFRVVSHAISVELADLGLAGKCQVRDLWEHKDLGIFKDRISVEVEEHGSMLLRLSPVK